MLFRNNDNRLESFSLTWCESLVYCSLDIWPDVRSVISVQINYLLHNRIFLVRIIFIIMRLAVVGDCIKVILIRLISYYIDCFVDAYFWMSFAVILWISRKNAVIWNFQKLNLNILVLLGRLHLTPLIIILNLRILLLFYAVVVAVVEVLLARIAQKPR